MAKSKLFSQADLHDIRNVSHKGTIIPFHEMKSVIHLVGEVAYVLYSVYRTYPFKESSDIHDSAVADLLDWKMSKVRRLRQDLEKAKLYATVRYGTKTDGITKMFVGAEYVALYEAGLPSNILQPKIVKKICDKLRIKNMSDIAQHVQIIENEYMANADLYE